jgi:hypothetical protein
MATIDTLRLYRFRLAAWRPSGLQLGLFLVLDLLETAASGALMAVSPPPAVPVHVAYAVVDVPFVPAQPSTAVASLGLLVGLLMGASLVYELSFVYQRSRYAFGRARRRASTARGPRAFPERA